MTKNIEKLAILIGIMAFLLVPVVSSAEIDLSSGDYLIYRGHKRIEIFDLNSESVVGSYNLDDIYPATDYWYYNHNRQGSGVLSDDFIFYAFQGQNADNLLAVDLESGESYDSGLGRSHDDAMDYSYAGITSSVAGSIVVPFYRSGACGYQYFSGVTLDPSLIDYYQLGNSYYTSNVRRHGDYYYLFSWTSSTLRIHRIDPETHVLDRAISTSSTSIYGGSTLTPEGYLAVVDGLKKLRIYDYSQEAGSELIFTGTLVGDPSETAGIPLWFYGATYEQGFYYYSPASKRIYDNSIVSGSVSQNWQTAQFGGGSFGDLFDPSVTGDYLYTIDYTGSGRATLRRHLKIDGSIDNTFSVLTYDGLDDDDSGFMLTSRIGEVVGEPETISASLSPPDDSTIENDDLILVSWENLIDEVSAFRLTIYQNDNPERVFNYTIPADSVYLWSLPNGGCYSVLTPDRLGHYGVCQFPLSAMSPLTNSVEGSDLGIDYSVDLKPMFYGHSGDSLISYQWHVIGEEWAVGDWQDVSIFPDYEFASFDDYYDEFGDHDEPNAMIASLGSMFSGTLGKVASILNVFQNRFNTADATAIGQSATSGISIIRGYLESFGIFFGGFPIGMFLMAWLGVQAGVVLWRLIKWIISLIPSIG